uniref:Uncharacterized protein n=1 Tax=viral metagenome TaxID=1070528 RepID=A0A6C0JKD4_9ZZZZ
MILNFPYYNTKQIFNPFLKLFYKDRFMVFVKLLKIYFFLEDVFLFFPPLFFLDFLDFLPPCDVAGAGAGAGAVAGAGAAAGAGAGAGLGVDLKKDEKKEGLSAGLAASGLDVKLNKDEKKEGFASSCLVG